MDPSFVVSERKAAMMFTTRPILISEQKIKELKAKRGRK